jgi:hypothetical protein
MKVTNAPATSVLARAAILFAALSALCLLLAGCASEGPGTSPAKMGYVERVGTAAMSPDPATQVEGSNGITVRVANGLIWVSQEDSNASRDYCAAPVTGRMLGRPPLPDPDQDNVIAVSARYVYYLAPARSGAGSYLRRLPIPAGCRVG